jgi:hypothetical protein
MQGVTLIVAVIFSLLALTLRPAYALAAYITAVLWYPSYLAMSIGTIDILVGRFVVTVLLLRCLCDDRIRSKFAWCRLDIWVALSMLVYVVVVLLFSTTSPFLERVENRGGFLMDTWFAYMVVRFIVTDKARFISVIKCISIVLAPLAILGVIESVTGWQPFLPLKRFRVWDIGLGDTEGFSMEPRWGFFRAIGPFSHTILFGGCFAMFLPLIYYLRYQKSWRCYAYILSGIALFGALSSMSSGPWVMIMVVVFCLAMEKYKAWGKRLLIFAVLSCILIGVVSNRPFYHVIASAANPLGGAGWHRAKLIDLAIEDFDEWCLVGYGDKDPGWGPELGMTLTDVTNHYILAGVQYGILGVITLCAILAQAFRDLASTYERMAQPATKSLCWAFGSLLFAVAVTWMSVSFFGQLSTLFYCCLGMIGSLCSSYFNWQIPNRIRLAKNYKTRKVS